MTALEILNKVEPNSELLTTEIAIKAMEEYAEQEIMKFDNWRINNEWYSDPLIKKHYRKCVITSQFKNNCITISPEISYLYNTTEELYQQFKKDNP